MTTTICAEPAAFRRSFEAIPALHFADAFAPDLLAQLMAQAAAAGFIDDAVEYIGTREIETPQRVGGALSVLLGRPTLYRWLEAATGLPPIRAVNGRLVQTRANGSDELAWHDDLGTDERLLAVVINLSGDVYEGGRFDLRRGGEETPLFSQEHNLPGAMTVFAVRRGLEHRVLPLTSGGPRRVYTGWFLASPEQAPPVRAAI